MGYRLRARHDHNPAPQQTVTSFVTTARADVLRYVTMVIAETRARRATCGDKLRFVDTG